MTSAGGAEEGLQDETYAKFVPPPKRAQFARFLESFERRLFANVKAPVTREKRDDSRRLALDLQGLTQRDP